MVLHYFELNCYMYLFLNFKRKLPKCGKTVFSDTVALITKIIHFFVCVYSIDIGECCELGFNHFKQYKKITMFSNIIFF